MVIGSDTENSSRKRQFQLPHSKINKKIDGYPEGDTELFTHNTVLNFGPYITSVALKLKAYNVITL